MTKHSRLALVLSLSACGIASHILAAPTLTTTPMGPGPGPGSSPLRAMYSSYVNGPWQNPSFFPIAVWWQAPTQTALFGPSTTTAAAAAAAEHINIFMAISGTSGTWPERFGGDNGELEAIKANHLYLIGGHNTPYLQNTSANSVASMLALANSIGAGANLIGYQGADEPACSPGAAIADGYNYPPAMATVPTIVGNINRFDPTRLVTYNETAWMASPQFEKCLSTAITALQATSIASKDDYPMTSPFPGRGTDFARSDFRSVPNDIMFYIGLEAQGLRHFAKPNQPVWAFIESGSDNYGHSETNNSVSGKISSGSNILTNVSNWSIFTSSWLGLTVSGAGIPANTKITSIVDATHAVMTNPATGSSVGEPIKVTGGAGNSDCVASVNLCVVNGNELRATPADVNAEVWASLINGANGIEWFCHDSTAWNFCLGPNSAGPAAATARANLTYINGLVLSYAPVLNASTVGMCSLLQENYVTGARSISSSCANGILTLKTTNIAVTGMAMVKQYNGSTYLFVQSDRRSAYGTLFNMSLAGLSGKTARVVYDSNAHYDPTHSTVGSTITLNASGTFSDTLGAHGDDYEVKIYQVQ